MNEDPTTGSERVPDRPLLPRALSQGQTADFVVVPGDRPATPYPWLDESPGSSDPVRQAVLAHADAIRRAALARGCIAVRLLTDGSSGRRPTEAVGFAVHLGSPTANAEALAADIAALLGFAVTVFPEIDSDTGRVGGGWLV